jgi:hypothetical protein
LGQNVHQASLAECDPAISISARKRARKRWPLREIGRRLARQQLVDVAQLLVNFQVGDRVRIRLPPDARTRDRQGSFMNFSAIFARIVALIGGAALLWRRLQGAAPAPAWGAAPVIPAAKPQGSIPTLKMPTARGWRDGQKPIAAPGLKVNAFATGLEHPRWITVLPNGDVLVAKATEIAGPIRSLFTMRCRQRCGAPRRLALAQTASPCCAIRTGTASLNGARLS